MTSRIEKWRFQSTTKAIGAFRKSAERKIGASVLGENLSIDQNKEKEKKQII